jgi:hypothetical protein
MWKSKTIAEEQRVALRSVIASAERTIGQNGKQ